MTVSLDGLHVMDQCDYHSHVSAQFGFFTTENITNM